jgi:hypothetical protein
VEVNLHTAVECMDLKNEQHLESIKRDFMFLVDTKYRKGNKEHGGNLQDLSDVQLLDAAIDEAIDQVTYLLTLREKIY